MKKIFLFLFVLLMGFSLVNAAYWVDDPVNCPATDSTNFPGQDCSPIEICGGSSGIAQCYNTSSIVAPGSSVTSLTSYSGSFGGGYILDCEATADSAEPYCDNGGNAWCNRDSSCYNVNRLTSCTSGIWGDFACSTCRSGYNYCDGSYTDVNGCEIRTGVTDYPTGANNNYDASCAAQCDSGYLDCNAEGAGVSDGCEILNGGECSVGTLTGVYVGCSGLVGNCVVDKTNFTTGEKADYSTIDPLLWGQQYGGGYLMELLNPINDSFGIDADACIVFSDGTTQCTASGSEAGSISGGGTLGYISKWTASDVLGNSLIYENGSFVGIGTGSPQSILHLNGSYDLFGGLTFGDGDSGLFETSDDVFRLQAGSGYYDFSLTSFDAGSGSMFGIMRETASLTNPIFVPQKDDADTGLGGDGLNTVALIAGGNAGLVYNGTSGNVGIGTGSPEFLLDARTTTESVMFFDSTLGNSRIVASADTDGKVPTLALYDRDYGTTAAAFSVNNAFWIGLDRGSGTLYTQQNDALIVNSYLGKNINFITTTGAGTRAVRMQIDSLGNVGIGTTNPAEKLHINGTGNSGRIKITDDSKTTTFGYLGFTGDPFAFDVDNGMHIRVGGDNSQIFRIDNVGNVGIGTTAPLTKLHIVDLNDDIQLRVGQTSGNNINPIIRWSGDSSVGANEQGQIQLDAENNVFNVFAPSSITPTVKAISILENGNVGIGTTSPIGNLHINTNSGSSSYMHLTNGDTGTAITDGLLIGIDSTEKTYIVNRENTDFYIKTNDLERMTIDSSGNVGINTTTPQNTLNVIGDGNFTGDLYSNGVRLGGSGELNSTGWNRSGTDVFLANSEDNVGIGTSSPASKLDVGGNVNSAWGSTGGYKINSNIVLTQGQSGSNGNEFRLSAPTALGFLTFNTGGSNERMRIDSSGNVGIGTTSPTLAAGSGMVIKGVVSSSLKLINDASGGAGTDGFDLYYDGKAYLYNREASSLIFGTNNSNRMTIDSTGNVGIGTASPEALLHLYTTHNVRNTRYDGLILQEASTAGSPYSGFGANLVWKGRTYNNATVTDLGGISVVATDHSTSTTGHEMIFELVSNSTTHEYSERMRIDKDGNVGIGTSSPGNKLQVNGSMSLGTFTDKYYIRDGSGDIYYDYSGFLTITSAETRFWNAGTGDLKFGTDNVEVMRLKDGNVGIGTTTPQEQLDIRGGDSTQGTLLLARSHPTVIGANFGLGKLSFGGEDVDSGFSNWDTASIQGLAESSWTSATDTPTRLAFYTTPDGSGTKVERMRIDNAGNVGIGTTSPGYKIDINTSSNDAFRLTDSLGSTIINGAGITTTRNTAYMGSSGNLRLTAGGATQIIIESSGNVGINTTTPQNILNVIGDGNFTGDVYSNGVRLGGSGELNSTGWNRSGTDVFLANSGDNVGIGTSSPEYALDIKSNTLRIGDDYSGHKTGEFVIPHDNESEEDILVFRGVSLSTGENYMTFGGGTNAYNTPQSVRFFTGATSTTLGGTERMRIDNVGNVGIGTITPDKTLEVAGQIKSSATVPRIWFEETDVSANNKEWVWTVNAEQLLYQLSNDGGTATVNYMEVQRTNNTVDSVSFPSGKVGVGTTSPESNLHVSGVGNQGDAGIRIENTQYPGEWLLYVGQASTGNLAFYNIDNSKSIMTLEESGNVGIGTTKPQNTLNVIGDINVTAADNDISMFMENGVLVVSG